MRGHLFFFFKNWKLYIITHLGDTQVGRVFRKNLRFLRLQKSSNEELSGNKVGASSNKRRDVVSNIFKLMIFFEIEKKVEIRKMLFGKCLLEILST